MAVGAFTLSYDEYARTTLTIGSVNTLPLEIYALISSDSTPTLFAIGTVTTAVSFLLIGGDARLPAADCTPPPRPGLRSRRWTRASMSSWSG